MPKKDYRAHQERLDAFRQFVAQQGWAITSEQDLPYDALQITISDGITSNPVGFFPSGKIVVQGKPGALQEQLLAWRETHNATPLNSTAQQNEPTALIQEALPPSLQEFRGMTRIGLDESGKGDYFGPLVVGAVCIDANTETKLAELGVCDSKQLYDMHIQRLAGTIKAICPHEVVVIGEKRYNELYAEMHNLNRLLAKGHAFALEKLLEKAPCDLAIADQFGSESYIREALLEKSRAIRLVQRPHAEEDIAVAAASVLARAAFVQHIDELSRRLHITLPKGASDPAIVTIGREIVEKYGPDMLARVAKMHFKTTEAIV